jgi:hypothetical protein
MTRRDEVVKKLRAFVTELKKLFREAASSGFGDNDDERLKRWKINVMRFLDANTSHEDATAFAAIYTSRTSALNEEHFKSAFEGHIGFLNVLIEELLGDKASLVTSESKSSGKTLPAITSFVYRKKAPR